METIAVYWESKIKIYGFQVATGLSLVDIFFASERLAEWGNKIQTLKDAAVQFSLVVLHHFSGKGFRVYLLMEEWEQSVFFDRVRFLFPEGKENPFNMISNVEMIHLQGPHFGDRYGIADTVFSALSKGGISLLAASCTGASIYLVLPEKTSKTAKVLLEGVFKIPERSGKRRLPIQSRAGVENEP